MEFISETQTRNSLPVGTFAGLVTVAGCVAATGESDPSAEAAQRVRRANDTTRSGLRTEEESTPVDNRDRRLPDYDKNMIDALGRAQGQQLPSAKRISREVGHTDLATAARSPVDVAGAAKTDNEVSYLDPEEAHEWTVQAVSEAMQWSLDQAQAHLQLTEKVGEAAEQLFLQYPDRFVGSVVPTEPGGLAKLLVKGESTDEIRSLASSASSRIMVVDRQPYSFKELEERQNKLLVALRPCAESMELSSDIEAHGMIDASASLRSGCSEASRRCIPFAQ